MKSPLLFINYRRDDTLVAAERLYQALNTAFELGVAYRDERSIPVGATWPDDLKKSLDKSAAVLVLIGPSWEHLRDAKGQRRIDAPDDWVRIEIETALAQGKYLIPVFVNRPLIELQAYPESIRPIHRLQSIKLDDATWDVGVSSIIDQLEAVYDWELRIASSKQYERETKQGALRHLHISDTLIKIDSINDTIISDALLANIKSDNKDADGRAWIDTSVEMSGEQMPLHKAITRLWQRRERHALLIGEGGMGKTVSLVRLWKELLDRQDGPIPLFLPMERFNNMNTAEEQDNFVENTLLNDYYQAVNDHTRKKLHDIWHKIGLNDQPRVVLLLDGLNEVSQSESTTDSLKKQLLRLFNDYPALQIVITSRYPSLGYALPGVDQFTNLYLSPLVMEKANEYLVAQQVPDVPESANIRNVFYNPLLLTLYAKTTTESSRYADLVQDFYKPKINTKGELLWNFTMLNLAKQLKQWKGNGVNEDCAVYLVLVFLPWLGYRMEKAEVYSIAGASNNFANSELNALQLLRECVAQYQPEIVARMTNNRMKSPGIESVSANDLLFFASQHLKLLTETPHHLGANTLPNISFRFLHQEFRAFFAAKYVLNELRQFHVRYGHKSFLIRTLNIPATISQWVWNISLCQYMGEISGEYQNQPFVKNNRWVKPNFPTEISDALNDLRGVFDRKRIGVAVKNTIAVIRSVRRDFSGEDFSNLYLIGVNLQNVIFSHLNGDKEFFATNLLKSKIDVLSFLTYQHTPMADERAGYDYPECMITGVFYTNNDKNIISSTKHNCIEWDTSTGLSVNLRNNPVILQPFWNGNMVPETPLYFVSNDGDWGVSIMRHRCKEISSNVNLIQAGHLEKRFIETGFIIVWNLKNCTVIREYSTNYLGWFAATKDFNRIITLDEKSTKITLWDTLSGELLAEKDLSFMAKPMCTNGERVLLVNSDNKVEEYDFRTNEIKYIDFINPEKEYIVNYTEGGKYVLVCNYEHYLREDALEYFNPVILEYEANKKETYGEISLVDMNSGQVKRKFKGHKSLTRAIDITKSNNLEITKMVSGADDGSIIEWDYDKGIQIHTYSTPKNMPTFKFISHSNTDIVAAPVEHGKIRLYDSTKMTQISILEGHLSEHAIGVFSLDGKKYLIPDLNYNLRYLSAQGTSQYKAEVWSIETGTLLMRLKGIESRIIVAEGKFNISGEKVLLWGNGMMFYSQVNIYDLSTLNEAPIASKEFDESMSKVFFSPDDKFIICISKSGERIYFWDILNNKIKIASLPSEVEVHESNLNDILKDKSNVLFLLLFNRKNISFISWYIEPGDLEVIDSQVKFRNKELNIDVQKISPIINSSKILEIKHCFYPNNREVLIFIQRNDEGNRGIVIYEYDIASGNLEIKHQSEEDVIIADDGKPYRTERGLSYEFFGDICNVVRVWVMPIHKYYVDVWKSNKKILTKPISAYDINFSGCKFPFLDNMGKKSIDNLIKMMEEHGAIVPDEYHLFNYPKTYKAKEINKNLSIWKKILLLFLVVALKPFILIERWTNRKKIIKDYLTEKDIIKGKDGIFIPSKVLD